jgi:hypothetical protein
VRFDLGPDDLPAAWFNLVPDMVGAGMQPLPASGGPGNQSVQQTSLSELAKIKKRLVWR